MSDESEFRYIKHRIEVCEWLDEMGILLPPTAPDSQVMQQLGELSDTKLEYHSSPDQSDNGCSERIA